MSEAQTPEPTQVSSTQTADAWLTQLGPQIQAHPPRKPPRLHGIGAWAGVCFLAFMYGNRAGELLVSLGAFFAIFLGFVVWLVMQAKIGVRADSSPQGRRYAAVQALIQAVAPDLAPGAELRWKLAPMLAEGEHTWLSGGFSLQDGRQVELRVTQYGGRDPREQLDVVLDLLATPNPAGLQAAQSALAAQVPVRLVVLQVHGRRVRATFEAVEDPDGPFMTKVFGDEATQSWRVQPAVGAKRLRQLIDGLAQAGAMPAASEGQLRWMWSAETGLVVNEVTAPQVAGPGVMPPPGYAHPGAPPVPSVFPQPGTPAAPAMPPSAFPQPGTPMSPAMPPSAFPQPGTPMAPAMPPLVYADPGAPSAPSAAPPRAGGPSLVAPPEQSRNVWAWDKKLAADLEEARENNRRNRAKRTYAMLSLPVVFFGGGALILFFRNAQAALAMGLGMLTSFVLIAIARTKKPRVQQRRILLARGLLSWLSRDLKEKSKVRMGLAALLPEGVSKQRWMQARLQLKDGTLLRLRIDAATRNKVRRRRNKTRYRTRVQEKLTVQLVLPQAPSRAAVGALHIALARSKPKLVRMQVDGRRVTARFVTQAASLRTGRLYSVVGDEDDNPLTVDIDEDAVGTLRAGEVIDLVIQLVTMLRPRSAPPT